MVSHNDDRTILTRLRDLFLEAQDIYGDLSLETINDFNAHYDKMHTPAFGIRWGLQAIEETLDETAKELVQCAACGQEIQEGQGCYIIDDGYEYFCLDDCLETKYSDDEYEKIHTEDSAYWTEKSYR